MTNTIAYFITDHGFGHAARSCVLIQDLLRHHSDLNITIVTAVPHSFFAERIDSEFTDRVSYIVEKVDVGILEHVDQDMEININVRETVTTMASFWSENNLEIKVTKLASLLPSISCIVFDITPLAPLVAKRLSVPSIAITNFAWCWMLETIIPTIADEQDKQTLIQVYHTMIKLYNMSSHLIKLPYCAPNMKGFEHVPSTDLQAWLGVKATLTPEQVFNSTPQLVQGKKHMLLSFGGHAFVSVILDRIAKWTVPVDWNVVIIVPSKMEGIMQGQPLPSNLTLIHEKELQVSYLDLLSVMDCVVGKTGYGLVSESINNRVPILYTDRASFREHLLLSQALVDNIACGEIGMKEVLTGSVDLFDKANTLLINDKCNKQLFDGGVRASELIFSLIAE